ncbi:MAG: glycosyl hydrolase, partial [Thermoanaerobaculia bacterium]|nr:glycosyl hydrolase [Thermoanaerobaculia bacterium]
TGAGEAVDELEDRIAHLRKAAVDTAPGDAGWTARLEEIETALEDLTDELFGDRTVANRSEPTSPAIRSRVGRVVGALLTTSSAPTATQRRGYEIAREQFAPVAEGLRSVEADLAALEAEMEAAGAPWTPGRIPPG